MWNLSISESFTVIKFTTCDNVWNRSCKSPFIGSVDTGAGVYEIGTFDSTALSVACFNSVYSLVVDKRAYYKTITKTYCKKINFYLLFSLINSSVLPLNDSTWDWVRKLGTKQSHTLNWLYSLYANLSTSSEPCNTEFHFFEG